MTLRSHLKIKRCVLKSTSVIGAISSYQRCSYPVWNKNDLDRATTASSGNHILGFTKWKNLNSDKFILYRCADWPRLSARLLRGSLQWSSQTRQRNNRPTQRCRVRLKLNTDKSELLGAGPRYGQSSLTGCCPPLQLGADTVMPQDDVRILGVTISSDMSAASRVQRVCNIFWLVASAQTCPTIQRSLDSESAATLVHAFVTSRVEQCNAVLAKATKSVTDTLQRVKNAAARVVSETRKFDHGWYGLTQILHDDLHWLDVADRVTYI